MGYLSTYFKKYFENFDSVKNYVIILQAPSKAYIGKGFKHVGACWLTKVDTHQEMQNNLNYINKVLISEKIEQDPRVTLFGYSQGVSIATRFLKQHHFPITSLIMHSGSIPEELTKEDGLHFKKYCSRFIHIAGTKDEYSNEEIVEREKEKIELLFGTDCEIYRPEIKHVVHVPLLEEIAQNL
ncbi:putative esterase/lipase [Nonlabens dokdonensis DSW-6]|uniref:Putative esterase/lipase n=1 Tax=Nonlabens dokdonensis (strain DSM 17205 / KCTC 12402 / DSW-6) TaxID=592029 RepID=L7WHP7_NONDD|nr:putative esterase/lipase [Nonlabens dokdonensis DSW-6]